ncbi:MAG: 2-amino-4-hydroxy-6-hydroxymethyldihydropteridine diphosphokinase [Planctomycetota bacterium]
MSASSTPSKPARACVALGSNIGDREGHIYGALQSIGQLPDTTVLLHSTLHETAPVGPVPQAPFLNAAAVVRTSLEPVALMRALLEIERQRGRDRSAPDHQHWGPRTLDLDLLLVERDGVSVVLDEPELTLPHPRMHERVFVLRPLAEVAWEWVHPGLGESVASLLGRIWRRT